MTANTIDDDSNSNNESTMLSEQGFIALLSRNDEDNNEECNGTNNTSNNCDKKRKNRRNINSSIKDTSTTNDDSEEEEDNDVIINEMNDNKRLGYQQEYSKYVKYFCQIGEAENAYMQLYGKVTQDSIATIPQCQHILIAQKKKLVTFAIFIF